MENEIKSSLILGDGTRIENLVMDGLDFISETKVDESVFTDENLQTLTMVTDAGGMAVYIGYTFDGQTEEDGRYRLHFSEKQPEVEEEAAASETKTEGDLE